MPKDLQLYEFSPLKTPDVASSSSSAQSKDLATNQNFVMDEYGQTPDHFYLARKPPTYSQVKRKLDLKTSETSAKNEKQNRRKRKSGSRAKRISDQKRYVTSHTHSLGHLTKKFYDVLTNERDGVMNLNTACALLSVAKRRLYDVTNVLEGIGLVKKTSRNIVQWMGSRGKSLFDSTAKHNLEKDVDILEAKENKLDELIYYMKTEVNAFKEKELYGNYLYVTTETLKDLYREDLAEKTVVGLTYGPGDRTIEITERRLVLNGNATEMEAYLLSENEETPFFSNLLNLKGEYEDNSSSYYKVQICNNHVDDDVKVKPKFDETFTEFERGSAYARLFSGVAWSDGYPSGPLYTRMRLVQTEDNKFMRAFVSLADDNDAEPHFLLTEDQNLLNVPMLDLEPHADNYSFSLDDGEGLTDLFDCVCGFPGP